MEDKEKFRWHTIKKIHFAMMAGVVLFMVICLFVLKDRQIVESPMITNLGLFAILPAIALATFIPSFMAKSVQGKDSFMKYQTVKLVQFAVMEGVALLNAVSVFQTDHTNSKIGVAVMLLFFLSRYPNQTEFNKLFPEKRVVDKRDANF